MKTILSLCCTIAAAAAITVGCAEDETPEAHFCSNLVDACDADHDSCDNVLLLDELANPECVDARADLLDCLAEQPLACPDTTTVYAGATPENGRSYRVDAYTAWTAACEVEGDIWEACRRCGVYGEHPPTEPPGGSYLGSCWDCTMDGSRVTCTCSTSTGEREDTLDVCSCGDDIANCDGELQCGACS